MIGGVTRGVGTVARTGAWAVREGAEMFLSSPRPYDGTSGGGEGDDLDK